MSHTGVARQEVDGYFYQKHKQVILDYLNGAPYSVDLWFSVGYFAYGAGRDNDHNFATTEQWTKLLKDTGREGR